MIAKRDRRAATSNRWRERWGIRRVSEYGWDWSLVGWWGGKMRKKVFASFRVVEYEWMWMWCMLSIDIARCCCCRKLLTLSCKFSLLFFFFFRVCVCYHFSSWWTLGGSLQLRIILKKHRACLYYVYVPLTNMRLTRGLTQAFFMYRRENNFHKLDTQSEHEREIWEL